MQNKNPYTGIIGLMRKHGADLNPAPVMLGIVSAASPDLKIKFGDLEVDKDNLLLADYLLDDYTRDIAITGEISFTNGITPVSGEDLNIVGSSKMTSPLIVNDTVIAIPISNAQVFVILAKVVSL